MVLLSEPSAPRGLEGGLGTDGTTCSRGGGRYSEAEVPAYRLALTLVSLLVRVPQALVTSNRPGTPGTGLP